MNDESLTIQGYYETERNLSGRLSNREIAAFSPVTFRQFSYPIDVHQERDLVRYSDVMHEMKQALYYRAPYAYSASEKQLILSTVENTQNVTARLGQRIKPLMSPLAAMGAYRIISRLKQLGMKNAAPQAFRFFEVGAGSGFLGRMLINSGFSYTAMDNTPAFYLWQNRFFQDGLKPGEFSDWANGAPKQSARVNHVPWWSFLELLSKKTVPASDMFWVDHALAEMSAHARAAILRFAFESLSQSKELGVFGFVSPGATAQCSLAQIVSEAKAIGFRPLCMGPFFLFYAGNAPELKKFELPGDRLPLTARLKNRLSDALRYWPIAHALFEDPKHFASAPEGGKGEPASAFMNPEQGAYPLDYPFLDRIGLKVPK